MKRLSNDRTVVGPIFLALIFLSQSAWSSSDRDTLKPNPRNFASVTKGAKLFQANCAACHGNQGEGAPDWRIPNQNGQFRPPPLNGSGHMWHHPLPVLLSIIRDGTAAQGGTMPAWKEKLSEHDMVDVIAWLQSKWSREIYLRWQQIDSRSHR